MQKQAYTVPSATEADALRMLSSALLLVRYVDRDLREDLRESGLDLASLTVLRQIEKGSALSSLIARNLRLDAGRVTRIVDQLVELGYVERCTDLADRRRSPLQLTAAGGEQIEAGLRHLTARISSLFADLSHVERQDLDRGLEGVRRALDSRL